MNDDKIIILTLLDIDLLQKALQYYTSEYPIINNPEHCRLVLRKLYSLESML